MQGLKTQESKKFECFFAEVQRQAQILGCVFFAFAGEGRDFETSTMELEDLSGWLIPFDQADAFEKQWNKYRHFVDLPEWFERFRFAIWDITDNVVTIDFKEIK